MYYPEEYKVSRVMNEAVIGILNKKFNVIQLKLNDYESLKDDGEVVSLVPTYLKERFSLELKRRASDTAISDYYRTGKFKYATYQIPDGYSVERGREHPVKFICYDNDMEAALVFSNKAINYKSSRYVRIKCEDSLYHFVKMFDVDLSKCSLIPLK